MRTWSSRSIRSVCAGLLIFGFAGHLTAQASPPGILTPEVEQHILGVLDDLHANQSAGMMNVTPQDGRLLRTLVQSMNARCVVEIGTSNGYSTIWMCLGLKATGGQLTTFEINPERAELARGNFKQADVADMIRLIEGDAHAKVSELWKQIDVLFLDADKAGYADYLAKLLPLVRPGGLILAHNTTDLKSMLAAYVDEVTHHPDLATIFLHEHDRGIAVSMKKWALRGELIEDPLDGAILGYINHIPPETPEQRKERQRIVWKRRAGEPILVHRGDWTAAPENTLEAYISAMSEGADGIEIDIRRSKDGVLYMMHDDTLDRTTEGTGKGRDKTYYEILQAGIGRKGLSGPQTRAPTLASVLVAVRQHGMLLHLDTKERGIQWEMARMFDEADVWDHIVEVNGGNAEHIRPPASETPRDPFMPYMLVDLIPYRGWFPKHDNMTEEEVRNWLAQPGVMIFCDDPRQPVHVLKRSKPDKSFSLPKGVRAWWTPDGIIGTAPDRAARRLRHADG